MGARPALLVGEAPTDEANDALTGLVGRRMASLAGVPFEEYLVRTRRVNLFTSPVTRWSVVHAREDAHALARDFKAGDRIVLLGGRVAAAFGVSDWPLYEWQKSMAVAGLLDFPWPAFHAVRLPHPSGRNRQLNDPDHRARMGAVLREVILG